jgi:predicted transcriptional regulator
MNPNEELARIINQEGLSQAEAARILGVTRGAVHNMVKQNTNISFERLFECAEMLGYQVKISLQKPKGTPRKSEYAHLKGE